MARHYVVAYPRLSERDHAWIQDYRARHDPRYFKLIGPHVTLVFGIADLGAEELVREVRDRAAGVPTFDFELAVATVNRDSSGEYYHEFLIPERGHAAIIRLHDRLYGGALARFLRLDIDFIPHVGIGNDADPQVCKRRVDAINEAGVCMPGRIEALDVIELLPDSVRTVERIPLA